MAGVIALVAIARRRRDQLTEVVTIIELTSVGIPSIPILRSRGISIWCSCSHWRRHGGATMCGRSLLLWLAIALAGIHVVYDVQPGHEVLPTGGRRRSTAGILLGSVVLLLWGLAGAMA